MAAKAKTDVTTLKGEPSGDSGELSKDTKEAIASRLDPDQTRVPKIMRHSTQ